MTFYIYYINLYTIPDAVYEATSVKLGPSLIVHLLPALNPFTAQDLQSSYRRLRAFGKVEAVGEDIPMQPIKYRLYI